MKIELRSKRNKFFLLAAALALVGIAIYGRSSSQRGQSVEEAPPTEEVQVPGETLSCDLILDFGEGKIATYSAVRSKKGTALDLLLEAAEENQFEVNYEESEMGAWIKSIAGVENTKDRFWMFWVKGKLAEKAADKQEIGDGDRVEFRFTKM